MNISTIASLVEKIIRETTYSRDEIISIISNTLNVDRGIVEWAIL